jgi:hypothetical protein
MRVDGDYFRSWKGSGKLALSGTFARGKLLGYAL